MSCLGAVLYDPAVAVSKGTAASAMAAFDTTNARITFTPTSTKVLVRIAVTLHGATTMSSILLGVLQGATVKGRAAPTGGLPGTALATQLVRLEVAFVVTGLVAGTPLTWDAAWGIETFVSLSLLKYGGPDNTTANDAFGGLAFEIWEA